MELRISGKVQGVAFRANTQAQARKAGLRGFVRNESDGSVTVRAEGDRAQLDALRSWCEHGPNFAVVREIVFVEIDEGHASLPRDPDFLIV